MRLGVQVREALPGDLESLVALCLAARQEAAVGAQLCTDDADRLRDQLGALLAVPGGRVLLGPARRRARGAAARPRGRTRPVHRRREPRHRGRLRAARRPSPRASGTRCSSAPRPWPRRPTPPSCTRRRCPAPAACSASSPGSGSRPAASHRVVTTSALQRRLAHEHGAGGSVRRSAPARARGPHRPASAGARGATAGRRAGAGARASGADQAARVDQHAGQPRGADRPTVLVLDDHLVAGQGPAQVQGRRGPGDDAGRAPTGGGWR